ncbi:MAG TPA: lysophospholipid acyltransferase family protein [Verrucomicrobiota bacterium]|nr:lysophospholipid acyltransferase family protein [Verrucomicrobiota bacterium]
MERTLRVTRKFFRFSREILRAVSDYRLSVQKAGLHEDYPAKAEWLQRWSRRVLKSLDVEWKCDGKIPERGILASTHVSYLDVLVIAAQVKTVFVAKRQVREWPLVGWVTSLAGTLYVSREHRGDVKRVAESFRTVIEKGLVAVFFPEGTSTDSHEIRPFYSSLFEPAVEGGFPITGAWVGYKVPKPYRIESDVCFWGDMGFMTHLIRLMSIPKIKAKLVFGKTLEKPESRKEAARVLREDVIRIAQAEGYLSS